MSSSYTSRNSDAATIVTTGAARPTDIPKVQIITDIAHVIPASSSSALDLPGNPSCSDFDYNCFVGLKTAQAPAKRKDRTLRRFMAKERRPRKTWHLPVELNESVFRSKLKSKERPQEAVNGNDLVSSM